MVTAAVKRSVGRALAVVIAGIAFATAAGIHAPPAHAVPQNFWGVVPQGLLGPSTFQRLKRGGVDSVRVPISWSSVQSVRGRGFDWHTIDREVSEASRAGIDVLPFLTGAPRWAVRPAWVPGSHRSVKVPIRLPVSGVARAGWINFVRQAVARYGPGGSFWEEHSELPRRPLRFWQVWNEPNFKYFVVRPNPAQYGKLVQITNWAAKSVDPAARVVLGGLFARPREARWKVRPRQAFFATDFLNRMYRSTPGVRRAFVGVALHPYSSRGYKELIPDIRGLRRVLARNRDARKGIWITELGWSSKPPNGGNGFAKGLRGQARELRGAFGLLRRMQRRWDVRRVFWFSVDDQPGLCNFCDGTGLFAAGLRPKPAWFVFTRFAGGRPR